MPPELFSHVPLLSSIGMGVWHGWVYLYLLFPAKTGKRQMNSKPRLPRDTQEIPELSAWHAAPIVGLSFLCNNTISADKKISDADSHHKTHGEKPPALQLHILWSVSLSWFLFQYQITYCLWPLQYKFQRKCCFTWCCAYLPPPTPHKNGGGSAAGSREINLHISASAAPFAHGTDLSFLRAAQVSGSKEKAAQPTPALGTGIVL